MDDMLEDVDTVEESAEQEMANTAAACEYIKDEACKRLRLAFPAAPVVFDDQKTYQVQGPNNIPFMDVIVYDMEVEMQERPRTWESALCIANDTLSCIATHRPLGRTHFKVARAESNRWHMVITIWYNRNDYMNRPFDELQDDEDPVPFVLGYTTGETIGCNLKKIDQ